MKKRLLPNGFTLIETLVALSVLLVALAGALSLVNRSLSSSYYAKDQYTAYYLAQEAFEFIRFRRDNNVLQTYSGNSTNWLSGLDSCRSGNTCSVDAKNNLVVACSGGVCSPLLYDSATSFYNTQTGTPSGYTRSIQLQTVASGEEAIRVTMNWRTGFVTRTYIATSTIFDWAGTPPVPYAQATYYTQSAYYGQATYYTQSAYYGQGIYYTQSTYYGQGSYYGQATYYSQSGYK